jgi:hypothetical protein
MFYFIRALEKAGLYDRAGIFYDRLTGFVNLNCTTIPERHFIVRSECHAWGAFPLYEFPRTLLGVRPAAPGWREIVIRPCFGMAQNCSGTVTTPVGDVEAAWERTGGTVKISGRVPEGIPCTVELPDGTREHLPRGGGFSMEQEVQP